MSALSRRLRRRRRPPLKLRDCLRAETFKPSWSAGIRVLRVGRRHAAGKYPYSICGTCGHVTYGRFSRDASHAHRAMHSRRSRARQYAYWKKHRGRW